MEKLSSNALLRVGLITLLVFTIARYSFDSLLLPLMGRSLSQGGDFQSYFVAALMVRERQNIYDLEKRFALIEKNPALPVKTKPPYLYPPLLAIALVPFTNFSFGAAYRVWVLVQQIFFVLAVLLLARNLAWLGRAALPAVILLAGNFYPLYQNVDVGQINLLILLTLCASLFFWRREQFFWAGVMIALGAMLKVSPVLLLGLFVLQRQWRAVWGFTLATLVMLALFVAVVGLETVTSFVTVSLGSNIPQLIGWINNASLAAFFFRVTHGIGLAFLERPLWYASIALILGALLVISYKKRAAASLEFALLYSAWVVASILVAPITWEHHLVVLLLPLGILLCALAALERSRHFLIMTISFAVIYLLLAFENVTLQRAGQWQFGTGVVDFFGNVFARLFFRGGAVVCGDCNFCFDARGVSEGGEFER